MICRCKCTAISIVLLWVGLSPAFSIAIHTETQKLISADAVSQDYFGHSVLLNGDELFISKPRLGWDQPASGEIETFKFDGYAWEYHSSIVPDPSYYLDYFGFAMDLEGERLLAGSPGLGQVFLFQFNGSTWNQAHTFSPESPSPYPEYGSSVAISGNAVAVGAYKFSGPDYYSGAIYIYRFDGASWEEEAMLTASDGAWNDHLGFTVAFDGNRLLAGAPDRSGGGAIYWFEYDGTGWMERGILESPDSLDGDQFGYCIALSDNRFCAGAPSKDIGPFLNTGAVYLYTFDGTQWNIEHIFTSSSPSQSEHFGTETVMDQDTIIIGAASSYDEFRGGSVRIFNYNDPEWIETDVLIGHDTREDDYMGSSLASEWPWVIAGAKGHDLLSYAGAQGAVYCFDMETAATPVPTTTPSRTQTPTPTAVPTGDMQSYHMVCVYAAGTTPVQLIEGAEIQAEYGAYSSEDTCFTDQSGCCIVSVYCHDTHYVSLSVFAEGYYPYQGSYLCMYPPDEYIALDPIYTFTPTPSSSASVTPEPTSTPAKPDDSTPTPDPTEMPCCDYEVQIAMPAHEFRAGDPFYTDILVLNESSDHLEGFPLVVLLEVNGMYFSAPTWQTTENEIDYYSITYPPGMTTVNVIDPFSWPSGVAAQSGVRFYGALLTPDWQHLISSLEMFEFSWF